MKKIDLPGEQWARLRDPDEVTERQRRPLVRLRRRTILNTAAHMPELEAAAAEKKLDRLAGLLPAEDYDALEDIDDLIIETLVADWSFELPVTAAGSLDLPPKARAALLNECRPMLPAMFGETSDEDVLDPDSPTVAANGTDRP